MATLLAHTEEFMTVQELAALLRVNTKTIYRMVERGDIHYYEVSGWTKRFHRDDVSAYLKSRRR